MLRYKKETTPESPDQCQCRIIHEDKVQGARESLLSGEEIDRLAGFFKAFADPTRLKILWALLGQEMCVCDLAALLGVSESAVSHQLRLLRQTYLVTNRREGPVLYYSLADAHVRQMVQVALEHIKE